MAAPDPTPESIFDYVTPTAYETKKYPEGVHTFNGPKKKLLEALNETLKAEFRHNPDTFLWGRMLPIKIKEVYST
jgi:2-oxoisovalerate dehydrogenase E1 component